MNGKQKKKTPKNTNKKVNKDPIGTYEEIKKLVSALTLFDDCFFAAVMMHKDAAEYLLRLCLNKPDLKIIKCSIQHSLRNIAGRSVTLDFIAEDSDGKIYNIEVQNSSDEAWFGPFRARYHQSAMDSSFVRKGQSYKDLPELFIIFITPFNPMKKFGLEKVFYEKISTIDGVIWFNGVHEIYLNSEVFDGSKLSETLRYFSTADPSDNRFGALSDAVRLHKEDVKEVIKMGNTIEEYAKKREEKGREEGKVEKAVECVNNLLKKGMKPEFAFEIANIDKATYNRYNNNARL